MEVQAHGNYYEDLKTRQITGLSKEEYDALKENGYTSGMDIMKGLLSVSDYSIKTTNGNKIDCGDILRRRQETDYNLVVGVYSQVARITRYFIQSIHSLLDLSMSYIVGQNELQPTSRVCELYQEHTRRKESTAGDKDRKNSSKELHLRQERSSQDPPKGRQQEPKTCSMFS